MTHGALAKVLSTARTNLNLYVLGPGVGECQVVLFPDDRVLVVDACVKDGRNLGIALLEALGITRVEPGHHHRHRGCALRGWSFGMDRRHPHARVRGLSDGRDRGPARGTGRGVGLGQRLSLDFALMLTE